MCQQNLVTTDVKLASLESPLIFVLTKGDFIQLNFLEKSSKKFLLWIYF